MPAPNRRRHANVIPFLSLAAWVLIGIFVCLGGLYYVNYKNQMLTRGAQVRELEKKLGELRNENEHAQTQIDMLASPNALRKRWESDKHLFAGYVPIPQTSLVVYPSPSSPAASDLRPVVNETH